MSTHSDNTTQPIPNSEKNVRQRVKTMIDTSKAVIDKTKTVAATPQLYVIDHTSKLLNIIALLCISGVCVLIIGLPLVISFLATDIIILGYVSAVVILIGTLILVVTFFLTLVVKLIDQNLDGL
eukprot:gene7204-11520_t